MDAYKKLNALFDFLRTTNKHNRERQNEYYRRCLCPSARVKVVVASFMQPTVE